MLNGGLLSTCFPSMWELSTCDYVKVLTCQARFPQVTRSSRKLGQVSHQAPYPDQWIVSQGLKAKLQPPEAPAS